MKTKIASPSKHAFTLIELLFVITIIGMLASLVASAVNIVIERAKRMRTHTVLKDIVMGVKNYQTEYNRYPLPPGHTGEEPIQLSAGSPMLKILLGGNDNKMNPRGLVYIEPPMAKNGAGGLAGAGDSRELTDYWGTPYEVIVDANNDNSIANPDTQNEDPAISKDAPPDLIAGVVAMSLGADKKKASKDDIVSWR